MSHHHCEIIMPPVEDVSAAIESILAPYSTHEVDPDGPVFLDGWLIGGRWAGIKADCWGPGALEDGEKLPGDICRLDALPEPVTASRVIFAGPSFSGIPKLEATFMLQKKFWNGTNHVVCDWDGLVSNALYRYRSVIERYVEPIRSLHDPKPDWLVVTVDYHN